MTRRRRITFVAAAMHAFPLIIVALLAGCDGDESDCVEDDRYVPMGPGTTWTWRVTEFDGSIDTLIVRSLSDTLNADWDEGAVWEFERNGVRRRQVAMVRGDTVAIPFVFRPDVPSSFRPILTFLTPLHPDDHWDGAYPTIDGPSLVEVVSRDTIQVPAGRFESAFRVRERGANFNDVMDVTTHLQPGVGIVRIAYSFSYFSVDLATLELLSYSLCRPTGDADMSAPTRSGPSSLH
jgi:hypothetical protein